SGCGCNTVSTPSGRPAERSRPGETIAATRPAPASRAAMIGQATIARPQTGCSIFGVEERIRVPSPAAITRTRGWLTDAIVLRQMRLVVASGLLGQIFAEQRNGGQRPAGEDQVDADEEADRPIGAVWPLDEDEDADQQAADAAEADPARVRLAAGDKGDSGPG